MTEAKEAGRGIANGWHEASTANGPIQYRIDGREDAPWLVFSNSHATNLSMWDGQVEALAADFRILRYDQRGHGKTRPPDGPCSFDGLAEDLVTVMDAAAIRSAILVGISMGAVTVLRVAARWPSRVVGIVAADGQWRSPPNAAETWQTRIDTASQLGLGALANSTIGRWFQADLEHLDAPLFAKVSTMIETTSVAGYVGCAQAMQGYDFSRDYPDFRMPVLYVVGARDGSLPATMQQMADATRDARFVVIPGAGHLPNLEQPQLFLDAIRSFLSATAGEHGSTDTEHQNHG